MPQLPPLLTNRSVGAPRGEFVGSATERLAELLNREGGMDAYLGWLTHPFTAAVLNSIEDMARQPQGVHAMPEPHEIPVQYGITTGLQYAALLFRDPTAITGGWHPEAAPRGDLPQNYGVTAPSSAPVDSSPAPARKRKTT